MKPILSATVIIGLLALSHGALAQTPTTAPNAPYNGVAMPPPPMGPDGKPMGKRPPDVVARSLSIALAIEAAEAATTACAGFQVGVSILDAAGLPKLYYVADGTAGSHAYTGFRKANTALLIKAPSENAVEMVKTDSALAAKISGGTTYVTWAGGLPIMAGNEMIGAIGVSGAEPSAKDEECAKAGLAKIQSRIK